MRKLFAVLALVGLVSLVPATASAQSNHVKVVNKVVQVSHGANASNTNSVTITFNGSVLVNQSHTSTGTFSSCTVTTVRNGVVSTTNC